MENKENRLPNLTDFDKKEHIHSKTRYIASLLQIPSDIDRIKDTIGDAFNQYIEKFNLYYDSFKKFYEISKELDSCKEPDAYKKLEAEVKILAQQQGQCAIDEVEAQKKLFNTIESFIKNKSTKT